MKKRTPRLGLLLLAALLSLAFANPFPGDERQADPRAAVHDPAVGFPTLLSPHSTPIAVVGDQVFVTNTPSDTVDVIDASTGQVVSRIAVGVDPVSVAVRPDGREIWVANHVSDSVSVIDNDLTSPTHLQVVATVQQFDERGATRFDEPVGIAFANNDKAYVALSSDNQIAVVDVASRRVAKRLEITAQDPRAIAVRGDRLYVVPFESNNQTQLSGGAKKDIDGDLVTFDAYQHSVFNNSILSLGHVLDIVKHPDVPDRDLYVFDTRTDELVETVDSLGTMLYGLAVNSKGGVYVAQADARNDANGRAGTLKHGLAEMENRAFLNRISRVGAGGEGKREVSFIDLEPLPPDHPEPGEALATPFGIEISDDDETLVVTAAGSDELFTVEAETGQILGRVEVDAVPRGVAVVSGSDGGPQTAWVYNAVENTVSRVDVADPTRPTVTSTVVLEDPTHPTVKRGRKAFETASASTTGTFSCASCHPDGHTDQLLWVLNTPIVTGGDQIQPRTTMPVRGLRDTEPYHWDGIPGDPYGGINAANIDGHDAPNSSADDQTTATRHLIDGSLANTMHQVGDPTVNDEGKTGRLSAEQRDDLAAFLLTIPYPPAQRRAFDNTVSDRALDGFRLFHIDGDGPPGQVQREVCGDCHRFPYLVSTNHPSVGMDTPTWRGAYDRFLILPQGRINIIEFDPFKALAEQGIPEREIWRKSWQDRESFDPVWDMVLEGSTGFSGSFARQLTLNALSAGNEPTLDLLTALEQSAAEEATVLTGEGVFLDGSGPRTVDLRFDATSGRYAIRGEDVDHDQPASVSRGDLVAAALNGRFVGTLTARHGVNSEADRPQPAIWALGPIQEQRGPQQFPNLRTDRRSMIFSGRHIMDGAHLLVNGRRVRGKVTLLEDETVSVELADVPPVGMHLLQLQNPQGLLSNDFIFRVVEGEEPPAVTSLGELLRKGGGEALLGTWVDAGTRGEGIRVTFQWKIRDQLLEMTIRDKRGPTIASISVDRSTDQVVHRGTNYAGTTLSGTWDLAADEGPRLNARFLAGGGTEGRLGMHFQLKGPDELVLAIQLAEQPVSNIPMIRAD